jgi:sugar lactone lactonase YvrE
MRLWYLTQIRKVLLVLQALWVFCILNAITGPIFVYGADYTLTTQWTTSGLSQPESALFDSTTGFIYVSNINGFAWGSAAKSGDGFISRLNSNDGSMQTMEWAGTSTGGGDLDAPKGMMAHEGTLYVADIDRLVAISLASGQVTAEYSLSGEFSLNDVTVDSAGNIYVSNIQSVGGSGVIYQLTAGATSLTPWLTTMDFTMPNGLFAETDRLIVGDWGTGIYAVSLSDKSVTQLLAGQYFVDGIWGDGQGSYFFSSGQTIYLLKSNGSVEELVTVAGGGFPADISYASSLNLILSPDLSNTVTGYNVAAVSPGVAVTGLEMDITGVLQTGDSVRFTASAISSDGGDIYFRFDLIPNYGTGDYDPANNFTTVQNFATQASYTHTFTTAGSYIMVVWASDVQGFPTVSAFPIIGPSVTVGGGQGTIDVTGLSMNLTQTPQVNDSVTFTASAISSTGGDIYYRFDLIPNYGTDDYDPANNFTTVQNFATQASYTHTFTTAGSYVMVVWASDVQGFPAVSAFPIIGGSVTVE